jgi:uncharacterized paraquat-inducible protein A
MGRRPADRICGSTQPVITCEFCDLLHRPRALRPGEKARCSRCGGVLARESRNPIQGDYKSQT